MCKSQLLQTSGDISCHSSQVQSRLPNQQGSRISVGGTIRKLQETIRISNRTSTRKVADRLASILEGAASHSFRSIPTGAVPIGHKPGTLSPTFYLLGDPLQRAAISFRSQARHTRALSSEALGPAIDARQASGPHWVPDPDRTRVRGMGIRSLLGLDLEGRLRAWKRRYKGDVRMFDHTTVRCSVSAWSNGTASIGAWAYCNDPGVWGLDSQPIGRFYSACSVSSIAEAELQLEEEVLRASRKMPGTSFFRAAASGSNETLQWLDGRWQPTRKLPTTQMCRSCGSEITGLICAQCGELIL